MVAERIRHYRGLAGLPDHVVPYSTRHGYASGLIEAGVSAPVVQVRLGHADGRMTANGLHLVAERHAREEGAFRGPQDGAASAPSPVATSGPHPTAQDCLYLHDSATASPSFAAGRTKRNRPRRVSGTVSRGAEHRARTGDLNLGKVALYQLS